MNTPVGSPLLSVSTDTLSSIAKKLPIKDASVGDYWSQMQRNHPRLCAGERATATNKAEKFGPLVGYMASKAAGIGYGLLVEVASQHGVLLPKETPTAYVLDGDVEAARMLKTNPAILASTRASNLYKMGTLGRIGTEHTAYYRAGCMLAGRVNRIPQAWVEEMLDKVLADELTNLDDFSKTPLESAATPNDFIRILPFMASYSDVTHRMLDLETSVAFTSTFNDLI